MRVFPGENIKYKNAEILDYISLLFLRLLFDLEKVTLLWISVSHESKGDDDTH